MDTKYNPKNLEFDTYIFYHWYEIEKLTPLEKNHHQKMMKNQIIKHQKDKKSKP